MLERVLYHDHCFDGAASAAYFSRFIAGTVHPDAEFRYTGMAHKASQLFDPGLFDGDENAIVDFKYSSDPRLNTRVEFRTSINRFIHNNSEWGDRFCASTFTA